MMPAATGQGKTRFGIVLMAFGIILIGANLRAPINAVGPVITEITEALGLTPVLVGLITTIPLIAFALLSTFAPGVARRFGLERVLLYSILVLGVGLFIRSSGSVFFLFLGAALIGAGIAIGNVLMPALIKKEFPGKTGLVTGMYLVSMNLTSALAAGYSTSIGRSTRLGWKASIGIWGLVAIATFLVWLPQVRKKKVGGSDSGIPLETGENMTLPSSVADSAETKTEMPEKTASGVPPITQKELPTNPISSGFGATPPPSIWKSKLAWQIALFMGLQSIMFYIIAAWFPTVFQSWGMSADRSGWMFSYFQLGQVPVMFIGPVLAARMKNQVPLIWVMFLLLSVGMAGILSARTEFVLISMILSGVALGLAFTLAMMFFVLRTKNTSEAADLSGMSQSAGYLVAACGPPLFGALFSITDSWTIPLISMAAITVALLFTGLYSAKDRQVFDQG